MRVFHGFDNLPHFENPVVTVGSYDGVHAGHCALMGMVNGIARKNAGESVVVTFSPHPRNVVGGGDRVRLLNTMQQKGALLEEQGIDNLIVIDFTPEFSRLPSYDFVREYLVGRVGVATLVVGFNHFFGYNKEGDSDYLDRLKREFGFDVYEIAEHQAGEYSVSSTAIRDLITRGDMDGAAACLGYRYRVDGVLGATGVLDVADNDKLLPGEGCYDVTIDLDDGNFTAQAEIADGVIFISGDLPKAGGASVCF